MSEFELTDDEKRFLLGTARKAVEKYLKDGNRHVPAPDPTMVHLSGKAGAFVTLHAGDRLRGCIGNFRAGGSLPRTIVEMAIAAATQDPRFDPVTEHEIDGLTIEISVLTPLARIYDPALVEVGKHGIYIIRGDYAGVLLPQVATEYGWDKWQFLDQTCVKAGLPKGTWKDPATEIYLFSAIVFGEDTLGRQ